MRGRARSGCLPTATSMVIGGSRVPWRGGEQRTRAKRSKQLGHCWGGVCGRTSGRTLGLASDTLAAGQGGQGVMVVGAVVDVEGGGGA